MKRRTAIITTAAVVMAAGIIGVTMAATAPQGRTTGKISTPGIGVEIRHSGIEEGKAGVETIKDGNNVVGVSYKGVPGADNKVSDVVTVWNTKERPIYLRVTINKTWSNEDGTRNFDLDPQQIKVMYKGEALANGNAGDGWIIKDGDADGLYDDGETVYCYYRYPINEGSQTSELIDSFAILTEKPELIGNEYTGASANVTFEADAIQQTAVEDAMLAEWGVEPTMDGTTITEINEQ